MGVMTLLTALPGQADDTELRQALNAARHQQWNRINHAEIADHVLEGYVEYHELKSRLPGVDPAAVNEYLHRFNDSPLSAWMRGVAQSAYGRAGRFDALLAVSDGPPDSTERQCWFYRALLDRDPERAAMGGRRLWLNGHSRPDVCNPLFDRLRANGGIDADDIWARMLMAWKAENDSLVSYLEKMLPDSWQTASNLLDRIRQNPEALLSATHQLEHNDSAASTLYTATFYRLTRDDPAQALELWQRVDSTAPLSGEQRHEIEHDLAFYSMVRHVNENANWTDTAITRLGDQDLLELRTRHALVEQHWGSVVKWIEQMAPDERRDAQWQYWLGRARQQLGDTASSQQAWQVAASQRSFFGFLAADRLSQPYELHGQKLTIAPSDLQDAAQLGPIRRVRALYRIDEPGLARAEWYYLIRHAADAQIPTLAQYALNQHWYDLAIYAAIHGDQWNSLNWRFPVAFEQQFEHWGNQRDIDPWLLMGVARRESSFNPQAQSPVGARGLMQLMPGTAAHVSRQLGIDYTGVDSLEQVDHNIRLGSAYLKQLIKRYQGNRVAAIAAYNAGPGNADRWLARGPLPLDLFVESITYSETRAYVKAVLSYRVIFAAEHKGTTKGISMLTPNERDARYGVTMTP
ncbi:transglycosylase SLT domain-containing protein [Kushneria phosphatilytica]|uniref:Transglycosylase SLT domain-containing protein n=2 Tax=Kushneria phosphatilytica TaxID=657387 RepID=A0A5C1A3F7_9GAMM|nr:transglycosylase SLT domain-containing protein [Kushneria phosphatilytica]